MEVDIDADIGRWILEFLLRQPFDDRRLNSLISILPLSNDNPRLKKSLLLRKLESEASNGSVSETLLDLLQQIEELDFQAGIRQHSGSIKAAYLAVAVACTVKFLSKGGGSSKFEYFDAVKRIWRGRVCKLEKAVEAEVGLVSEELWSWKDDIEAAVWEDSACDVVLKRSEGIDAIEAIRVYVEEEKGKMGPSFLELIAEALRVDEELRVFLGNLGQIKAKGIDLQGSDQDAGPSHENREVHREDVFSRPKHVSCKRRKGALAGTNRGAKIADVDTSDVDESCKKYDLPSTPEVNRVLEALESSSLELQAAVKDPLPDSLRIAENLVSDMTRKNTSNEPLEESHTRAGHSVSRGSQAIHANEENLPRHSYRPQNNASRPSLLARNGTACTFQWDDSIDGLPEDSPNEGRRLQLPSPKRTVVSPPKTYESYKVTRRRKPKRWTTLEEDTLRAGVQKYGKGNWKVILKAYSDVFEERTEVDLKDKWRNLIRY